jgi:hypothetical protein
VRITLKPVNGNTASNLVGASNVAGRSFFDMLAQASGSAANEPALAVAGSKSSSNDTPDQGSADQTSSQPIAASENDAADAQEISTASSSIRNSAAVIVSQQNQDADSSRTTLTIARPATSPHSQPQSKASQPAEKQVTNSIPQASAPGAAQQIVVRIPPVTLSEFSFGRSTQSEATSTTASTEQPAFPEVRWSNANSAAPTGSDGAATSQSLISPPAVTRTEVSNGRSTTQNEATSPAVSADLPALPAFQWSIANSIAQTAGNGAATSPSPVPLSTSPAVTLSETSFGRSTQYDAASPIASAEQPAFPGPRWSNANSAAQIGSNGAATSQSPAPPSASPVVTPSEVSFTRSTQYEAVAPKASTDLPAFPMVQRSIANSAAQTGSNGADTSQSPMPPTASPAVSQPEVSNGRPIQYEPASPKPSAALPALPMVQWSIANSTTQTGSNVTAASQSPAPPSTSPAVLRSQVFVGRSMQYETASLKAPAELPAFPTVQRSNANAAAQTGSDGADTNPNPASPSASPAVPQPEVSNGRPMQNEAASPKASAALPAFPAVQWALANSIEQTGSGVADARQSSVPTSASPATTDFSKAIAAGLIEQSTFAIGSAFSQSMTPSKGAADAAGTFTDKTSQFKSSGATFTVNSGDTSSSKPSSVQDSISADHSAQNGNPLPQHALADSSAATPIAIKPLEAAVTQTVPVSSHTPSVSSSQPHAALSVSDAPAKAQDSADAAADQLERTGSAAAGGINTARLVQTISESEMRVGMRSTEFGDISIRTSVSQQQLTAQISVDHSELGSAISAHLPSLQSKLGSDFGLHASIEVNQLGGSATGANGQSSHQNHKMTSQPVPLDSSALQADVDPITLPHESLEVSRLDIRA